MDAPISLQTQWLLLTLLAGACPKKHCTHRTHCMQHYARYALCQVHAVPLRAGPQR